MAQLPYDVLRTTEEETYLFTKKLERERLLKLAYPYPTCIHFYHSVISERFVTNVNDDYTELTVNPINQPSMFTYKTEEVFTYDEKTSLWILKSANLVSSSRPYCYIKLLMHPSDMYKKIKDLERIK